MKYANTEKEVSLIAVQDNGNTFFKVTKHVPQLEVSETKVFSSKTDAKRQFDEWLE